MKGALISFPSRKMLSLQLYVKGTQSILDWWSNCPGKESFYAVWIDTFITSFSSWLTRDVCNELKKRKNNCNVNVWSITLHLCFFKNQKQLSLMINGKSTFQVVDGPLRLSWCVINFMRQQIRQAGRSPLNTRALCILLNIIGLCPSSLFWKIIDN